MRNIQDDIERCYREMLAGKYVPSEEERSRTFSLTLPKKILTQLDQISRGRNISRSFFVRQLILNEIENQKKGLPPIINNLKAV